jgi:hypothetical protein
MVSMAPFNADFTVRVTPAIWDSCFFANFLSDLNTFAFLKANFVIFLIFSSLPYFVLDIVTMTAGEFRVFCGSFTAEAGF